MFVDIHTHLPKLRETSEQADMVEHVRSDRAYKSNVSWEEYIEAMAPVDKAFVFGIARGGENPNDEAAALANAYPNKIIGFMSVDPGRPDALDEMERAAQDLGLKGLKLGPMYQNFHPCDPRAFAVYGRAQKLGLPVIFHQATSYPRTSPLKYGLPILLEDVALAFPDLKIVIAHMGHPWQPDTIAIIRKQPNVYSDISALFYRPWQFYNALVLCWEYRQLHKLLFGTDFPVTTPKETLEGLYTINRFAEGTNLPVVPPEEIEALIHRDALALLGVEA